MEYFTVKIRISEEAVRAAICKALYNKEVVTRRDRFISVCRDYIEIYGSHSVDDHLEEFANHIREANKIMQTYLPLVLKNSSQKFNRYGTK